MAEPAPADPDHWQTIADGNSWANVYWFSRAFINSDRFGQPGKKKALLVSLSDELQSILDQDDSDTAVERCIELFHTGVAAAFARTSRGDRIRSFCEYISERLVSPLDVRVLIFTMRDVLLRLDAAIEAIPSNDQEFAHELSTEYLDSMGDAGLANVIRTWDTLGEAGCIARERAIALEHFTALRARLRESDVGSEADAENLVLTAFMQEYERRAGQKRKGRAGGSLEDVTTFIFEYYELGSANAPDHFQADLEVDRWVKGTDGWLVGISCKRTLRERWKQVSAVDRNVLSRYKIKSIWNVITFDADLSDDKITLLGSNGHVFFLPDDSPKLARAEGHVGLRDFVKPMSSFVTNIRAEQA